MNTLIALITLLLGLSMSRYLWAIALKANGWNQVVKKDYTYQPMVSVLMPCFNEGKTVYETVESISNSAYPRELFEVIAVDDCSVDNSYEWLLKAQADFPHVTVLRNEHNSGKAETVLNALHHSTSGIVISIDSDCTFAENTISELVACLADPTVGAVGGCVGVKNVNTNILTQAQTLTYYSTFHIMKAIESWTKTVICISGCLFAIRREVYLKAEPQIRDRNWFGIAINEGEDRFLTHQVLLQGYGTYLNTDAQCWTTVPDRFSQLFKQQLRWRRGALRDFFTTMRSLPLQFSIIHINGVLAMTLPIITLLLSVAVLCMMPTLSPLFWLVPTSMFLHGASECVLSYFINKYNPEQKVAVSGSLILASAWLYINVTLTLLALCTLHSGTWGTRDIIKEKINA